MTEKELSDFIEHGESGIEEFEIAFGYVWANMAIQIAKELRARLAQPEPDYEAEFIKDWNKGKVKRVSDGKRMVPEREWVGLTDEEVKEIYIDTEIKVDEHWRNGGTTMMFPTTLYQAIEAKLKEKNSG
jgi:hypothetical protein